MAGSIHLDLEALSGSIQELQALSSNSARTDALSAFSGKIPTESTGQTAQAASLYFEQFSALNAVFENLLSQTIAVLSNAEEYFSMTDEELASYFAQR